MNFVTEEIAADTEVELKVDWTRRFDNMQQHSGRVLCHHASMPNCPCNLQCLELNLYMLNLG